MRNSVPVASSGSNSRAFALGARLDELAGIILMDDQCPFDRFDLWISIQIA